MTTEERSRLEALDSGIAIGKRARTHSLHCGTCSRTTGSQKRCANELGAVSFGVLATRLPPEIRSAWVFVLRAGADTGAERHPNSHQRMMSFEGCGDLQTGEPGKWQSNVLVSDPNAPLERRWISIPTNVWHRPVIDAEADWAVVSFHTVPAEELIEERPDESREAGTRQMKYLGSGKE